MAAAINRAERICEFRPCFHDVFSRYSTQCPHEGDCLEHKLEGGVMRRTSISIVAGLLCGVLACGGDDGSGPSNPPPGGANNGTFTAQINGTTWSAAGTITVTRLQNNFIGIAGSGFAGGTAYSVVLGIGNAPGPGTHSLDLATGDGSSLIIGGQTGGWGTAFQGGTGTVTITSLTANRIVGTFSAVARPGSGNATGNLTVTNGQFDVTF